MDFLECCDDSTPVRTSHSLREFILSRNDEDNQSIYTAMRTYHQTSILLLERHLKRIYRSSSASFPDYSPFETISSVRQWLFPPLQTMLKHLIERYPNEEYVVGVVVIPERDPEIRKKHPVHIHLHGRVYVAPPPLAHIEVWPMHRDSPSVKKTQWVKDRSSLEQRIAHPVQEIVMQNEDGFVLEGLSSNFFVVDKNNVVYTASYDDVLRGTVRDLVINICKRHDIELKFSAPTRLHQGEWDSAFITSSSRLVMPIESIEWHTEHDECPVERLNTSNQQVLFLRAEVEKAIVATAENVLPN